ncbi:RNA-guided endonuclease InsQ/TnpB family protein [Sulfurihydrogenibium subterraneum]|uniref:RNA-guided endonuclease InsQ/TnpB family protein n=1 Tax=Sulfurihydrogenibium subterraneum TaxID=171121 RepID=UPI00048A4C1D|nr:RNA-guided endonuclease TnpB family protein [Sulfurihydrogenibium subterraneum]
MKTNQEIIGTYFYPCYANKGKADKVIQIITEYRKTAQRIAKYLWSEFFKTGKFSKYKDVKSIRSNLSERYKQTCLWQVISTLNSFVSNIQEKFKEIVYNSTLPEEIKKTLFIINKNKAWFSKDFECSSKIKKLARKIFKHNLKQYNKPSFKNINLHLDSKVAVVEHNKQSKTFDRWIKLSTLEKGKPIYLPIKNNRYAENLEGELANFCQISVDNNNIIVKLMKKLKKRKYLPETDTISIDLGLNPLFAASKGNLIGRNFMSFLKRIDEKITKRMAHLQKIGIKPKQDNKYRELVRKFREFLKNEINRYINRLVEIYKPATIVIEKLDFRNPELSKRINRLISNFGKRYIKDKLNRLQEIYGIKIIQVNPAYTSQVCSSCGYVDKKNRKDTNTFECKVCGAKINAQVNGAKNILARRSCEDIKLHHSKKQVLRILVKRYLERQKGCYSAPLEVIKSNPYFKDYLDDFLNPAVVGNKRL